MSNLDLNLTGLTDDKVRENFQKVQDLVNGMPATQNQVQACEIYVTANVSGLKISHGLGAVPLDLIITRLIAPSATRLTAKYSEFTKDEVVFDITGLLAGETLSARFVVGTFPNVVSLGDVRRGDAETEQFRGKF